MERLARATLESADIAEPCMQIWWSAMQNRALINVDLPEKY